MTTPVYSPVIETIPEQVEAIVINDSDWGVLSQGGVTKKYLMSLLKSYVAASASAFSSGMIIEYGGSSAPSGWLICNGAAVSRTTYASLFAIVGTTYGSGDGSTTFNLPDFRGRVPMGVGQGAGLTNRVLGTKIGTENSTDSDTPTITVGSTTVTGTISITPFTSTGTVSVANFTPTGTIAIDPATATFSGNPSTPTGTIELDPHHHSVIIPALTSSPDAGQNTAAAGTYTTSDETVTGTFTGDPMTPSGTIAIDPITGSVAINSTSTTATLTMNQTSPTGSVTLNSHSHTGVSSAVNISVSTIQPSLVVNFIIKI